MATMAQNITRIENAKTAIKTAIENKGVSIPTTAKIDTYSTYVDQIETGGGGGDIDTDLETYWNSITNYNNIYSSELISPQIWEKYKQCFFNKNLATSGQMTNRGDMLLAAIETINSNTQVVDIYRVSLISTHPNDYYDLRTLDLTKIRPTSNLIVGIEHNKSGTDNIQIDFRGNHLPTLNNNISTRFVGRFYSSSEYFNLLLTDGVLDIRNNLDNEFYGYYFSGFFEINGGDTITVKNSGINLNNLFSVCGGIKTVNFHPDSIQPKYIRQFVSGNSAPATTDGVETVNDIDFGSIVSPCYFANVAAPMFRNLNVKQGSLIGGSSDTNLHLTGIWNGDASTFGANYENFINRLGNNTSGYTKTIRLNATLKNSLSAAQLALATNKGYTIA